MRKIIALIFFALGLTHVTAQKQIRSSFKMPSNAKYSKGRVLVKVRNEFQSELASLSGNKGGRVKNLALNGVIPLVKPEMQKGAANGRTKNPAIDISKYYSLTFDPGEDVEKYINQLYATGYFEIVEPEYKYKTDLTPNDPAISQQYYLGLIKAFDAWDITQGDTSVVIAIVDTGGNLSHADLSPNLYKNWRDPINGIDDDNNGYIDDYQGWDFIGADTANVNNPDFIGDNDPSINPNPPTANVQDLSHGTWVAGCASASTNNGIGIAGVGYKTRLLFTKHSADDQKPTDGSEYNVYNGMLYAAYFNQTPVHTEKIRMIINCSFGGSGQSQIIQDIINHIVLDRNCVVVAAAGNDGNNTPGYPASYDNVLSVAATDENDKVASFSSYGTYVGISAPGVDIYTTQYNNTYSSTTVSGTSFSTPITSGAAALVWAANPGYTASQVREQLRVSADATALYTANPTYVNELGVGRLDIKRALTLTLPSIRASNPKLVNQNGFSPVPGDKAFLSFDFTNYLNSTSGGIKISISTLSAEITISKSAISPGIIAGGSTISNNLTPFELTISSTAPQNTVVYVLITYSDGSYSDYQYVSFFVNPSFIDVNSNQIGTTVTGIGRIGFQDTQDATRTEGQGFIFNQNQLLFEMGLIMGTDSTHLFNNVRGLNGGFDEDFSSTVQIKQIVPGLRSYSEIYGEFSNSTTTAQQAVVIDYRSLVWQDSVYSKFVILEFQIKNPTANALSNFYFGIFADWDITNNGANDAANWDNGNNLGYVYPAISSAKPYAGIQLLTGSPAYYAIDNDAAISGNPFGLYNSKTGAESFTHGEKFETISAVIGSGRERLQAGTQTGGDDVSHVVSSGPLTIAAGQTVTVAFALHAANNLSDLQKSARYADSVYNYTLKAVSPIGDSVAICYKTPATLNASGASVIKWYNAFTGGQSFFTGTRYTTGNLLNDTTFYVSNADHSYGSVRSAVKATVLANPKISTSGSTILCQGDTVKLSVAPSDSTLWSDGEKTNTIQVQKAGKYAVEVKNNALSCVLNSDTILVTVNPRPTADFSTSSGDLKIDTPITFTDQSTDAITWFWNFGDGQSSSSENTSHSYTVIKNYTVTLTVTATDGCADFKSSTISVITAIEEPTTSNGVQIFPNPVNTQSLKVVINYDNLDQATLSLTNSVGQVVLDQDISSSGNHVEIAIPTTALPAGLYIIRLKVGDNIVARKVIKSY
jgi:serine protease